ncbi:uncharacterized protein LOC103524209 [Gryllus bimaculatus]|nr:uncharacterized protein LOC103524209 [Gryllus bimaculatus]
MRRMQEQTVTRKRPTRRDKRERTRNISRVIDGTLYGAGGSGMPPQPHQRCPSFTASVSEEMESSGVYSDLDRRGDDAPQEEGADGEPPSPTALASPTAPALTLALAPSADAPADLSPDGSLKTLSSRSPACDVPGLTVLTDLNATLTAFNPALTSTPGGGGDGGDRVPFSRHRHPGKGHAPTLQATPVSTPAPSTPRRLHPTPRKPAPKTELPPRASYKMRSATSPPRSKTMLSRRRRAARRRPTDDREARPPSLGAPPRPWDAVLEKIAVGQAEQKLKPRLKEVKSKVFAGIATPPAAADAKASATPPRRPDARKGVQSPGPKR